jgi:hypothetical protein
MSETALIEQLTAAVAQLVRPAIPVDIDLWDMATIAHFLKRDPQVVRERMACLPSFPKAVRLPTMTAGKAGRSQPLYFAKEIIAWAKSYQEKH